jgi:hypothetical protein
MSSNAGYRRDRPVAPDPQIECRDEVPDSDLIDAVTCELTHSAHAP